MLTRQFPLSPLHRSKSRSSARTRTNVAECSRRRPSVAIEWLARTLFSTRRATIVLTDLKGVYMSDRENGNHGPNGFSVSIVPAIRRLGVGGLSGTYYWNPGSPDSPSFTVTGIAGVGKDVNSTGYRFPGILGLLSRLGLGAGPVFLRDGMTSKDTLGPGITANQSTMIPSVTINSTFPRDKRGTTPSDVD